MMDLEIYYNNLSIRLFVLFTLNIILSSFYLKYLNHSNRGSLLKQKKDIYLLLITYWILFNGIFFPLITLNIILSSFYLKYLNHSNRSSLLKQEKDIYLLQLTYWILFTGGFFVKSLPSSSGNVIGYFASEFLILSIIFISYTFLLWKLFNKKRFDFGIFFFTIPLIMLFCFVLGIV